MQLLCMGVPTGIPGRTFLLTKLGPRSGIKSSMEQQLAFRGNGEAEST